jgi:hypothetical protein
MRQGPCTRPRQTDSGDEFEVSPVPFGLVILSSLLVGGVYLCVEWFLE